MSLPVRAGALAPLHHTPSLASSSTSCCMVMEVTSHVGRTALTLNGHIPSTIRPCVRTLFSHPTERLSSAELRAEPARLRLHLSWRE